MQLDGAALAFFLDVDGTLLPIAESPDAVLPSARACAILAALGKYHGGAVALVSGRPLSDLDALFRPQRFPMASQHGAELRDAAGHIQRVESHLAALDALRPRIRELAASDDRLLLEDKGLSLALHYRRAPELEQALHAELVAALQGSPELRLQTGKRVLEARSTHAHKGRAIRTLMEKMPFVGRVPVFIGDDATDESGFEAVNALGGLSIKVGQEPSIARERLPDTAAVLDWLAARGDADA